MNIQNEDGPSAVPLVLTPSSLTRRNFNSSLDTGNGGSTVTRRAGTGQNSFSRNKDPHLEDVDLQIEENVPVDENGHRLMTDGVLRLEREEAAKDESGNSDSPPRQDCCSRLSTKFARLFTTPIDERYGRQFTLGERVADAVSIAVGSWRFVSIQSACLVCWLIFNIISSSGWDPYPFILLNLMLSFQAAYTAPIIMMSQNRQSDVDREKAMDLHEKVDHIRLNQVWALWDKLTEHNQLLTHMHYQLHQQFIAQEAKLDQMTAVMQRLVNQSSRCSHCGHTPHHTDDGTDAHCTANTTTNTTVSSEGYDSEKVETTTFHMPAVAN